MFGWRGVSRMLLKALFSALLVVRWVDAYPCDGRSFLVSSNPTKYCNGVVSAWSGGTDTLTGGCNHWVNGSVDDCKCETVNYGVLCGCSQCLRAATDCTACSGPNTHVVAVCGCTDEVTCSDTQCACNAGYTSTIGDIKTNGCAVICSGCEEGQYVSTVCPPSQTVCSNCEVGKYQSKSKPTAIDQSPTACDYCPSGYACMSPAMQGLGGAVACMPSSTDLSKTHTTPYVCSNCLNGDYGCRDYKVSCPMGTFFDASKALDKACQQCPRGKYQDSVRTLFKNDLTITSCATCEAGKYANLGATTCIMCEAGKYADLGGASACEGCAPGSYSNIDGATACTLCGPGTYSGNDAVAVGNDLCNQTIAGTYVSGYGATAASVAESGIYGLSMDHLWIICWHLYAFLLTLYLPGRYTSAGGATSSMSCCTPAAGCKKACLINGGQNCGDSQGATVNFYAKSVAYCDFCTIGHFFDSSTKKCASCVLGETFCLGGGADAQVCRGAPPAASGQFASQNCSTTHNDTWEACSASCPPGEFMITNCTKYANIKCQRCESCDVTPRSYNFMVSRVCSYL